MWRRVRVLVVVLIVLILGVGPGGCRKPAPVADGGGAQAPAGSAPSQPVPSPTTSPQPVLGPFAADWPLVDAEAKADDGIVHVGPVEAAQLKWLAPGVLAIVADSKAGVGRVLLLDSQKQLPYEPGLIVSEDARTAVALRERSLVCLDLVTQTARTWTLRYENFRIPVGWLSPDGQYLLATLDHTPHTYTFSIDLASGKQTLALSHDSAFTSTSWSPDGGLVVVEEILCPYSCEEAGAYRLLDLRTGSDQTLRGTPSVGLDHVVRWTATGAEVLLRGEVPSGEKAFCYDPRCRPDAMWTDDSGLAMTQLNVTVGGQTNSVDLAPMLTAAGFDLSCYRDPDYSAIRLIADWVPGLRCIWLTGYAYSEEIGEDCDIYGAVDAAALTGMVARLPQGLTSTTLGFVPDGSGVLLLKDPWGSSPDEAALGMVGLYVVDPATLEERAIHTGEILEDLGLIQGVYVLAAPDELAAVNPEAPAWTHLCPAPVRGIEAMGDDRLLVSRPQEVLTVGTDGTEVVTLVSLEPADARGAILYAWPSGAGALVLTEKELGRVAASTGVWQTVVKASEGQVFESYVLSPDGRHLALLRASKDAGASESCVDIVTLPGN